MDFLSHFWGNVSLGFSVAGTPMNLLLCFIGVFLGTLIGVLPGIGPMTGVALLIPLTFSLKPTAAIILMAGIYYGAMYGGSTTSILREHAGRVFERGDVPGRIPDGEEGPGGPGAGGGGDRFVHRGHLCDPHADAVRAVGCGDRAQIRPPGVFLPDVGGAHRRDEPGGSVRWSRRCLRRCSVWRSPPWASTTRAGFPGLCSTIPS